MKPTKKLTVSALYIATFLAIIGTTAGISFGAIQIRVANALYAIPYLFPFLVIPAGVAVVISNLLFGGLGLLDIIGGFTTAVTTTYIMTLLKKFNLPKWTVILPTLFIPALLVPIWLSYLLGIPYLTLAISLCLGHVFPAILGYFLVKSIDKSKRR